MELSMKRSGIACCEKVFEYAMPVEQATETVVPDTMPDVERILCAEGMVIIRSKEVSEGRVTVSAGVAATVLYSPEDVGEAEQSEQLARTRAAYSFSPSSAGASELRRRATE